MDQAPGPIIASTAAKIAWVRAIHGSLECDENRQMAMQALAKAASTPATGVNRPTDKSIPATMPTACRVTNSDGNPWHMLLIPE